MQGESKSAGLWEEGVIMQGDSKSAGLCEEGDDHAGGQ